MKVFRKVVMCTIYDYSQKDTFIFKRFYTFARLIGEGMELPYYKPLTE